jgi:hypothetical protein
MVMRRHRNDCDLIGRKPRRQRGPVVLEQHAAEPLERAVQRAMQHHDLAALPAGVDIAEVEALRHDEVELDGSSLPRAIAAIAEHELELRTVDRAGTGLQLAGQAEARDGGDRRAEAAIRPRVVGLQS